MVEPTHPGDGTKSSGGTTASEPEAPKTPETPKTYPLIVQIIGALIVGQFLVMIVWILLYKMDSADAYWTRLTFLFNSVQSVAFAVVGALFGTQVQKIGTEIEKQRADKAEEVVKPSKQLALLVSDSSQDMGAIFANAQVKTIIRPTTEGNHARMQALARQILAS